MILKKLWIFCCHQKGKFTLQIQLEMEVFTDALLEILGIRQSLTKIIHHRLSSA